MAWRPSRYYNETLDKIREALKEAEHVRKALRRMEMAAQQGGQRQSVQGLYAHPDDRHFQDGLRLFQAWPASLFESYVTLFCYLEGSNGASQKVKEFASASLRLNQTRKQEELLTSRHAEMFESLTQL